MTFLLAFTKKRSVNSPISLTSTAPGPATLYVPGIVPLPSATESGPSASTVTVPVFR